MLRTVCPICGEALKKTCNSAVCTNGHSFDFAKEGYLNLLMPSKKHSQNPGDNKDMVLARKRFLEGGYYSPLADEIADIVCKRFRHKPVTLIDAGVGTGYYLNKIIEMRKENSALACAHAYSIINKDYTATASAQGYASNGTDVYLGADISKIAVRYAAKLNPAAECCVASVYDLPYADGIADVVTCVFSPYALEEYKRVLKPDGLLIIASPCENHLIELRRALYENVREVEAPVKSDGFDIISEKELTYTFTLNNSENIAALLMMTPYAYRAPLDRKASLLATAELSLTADFKLSVLRSNTHRID